MQYLHGLNAVRGTTITPEGSLYAYGVNPDITHKNLASFPELSIKAMFVLIKD